MMTMCTCKFITMLMTVTSCVWFGVIGLPGPQINHTPEEVGNGMKVSEAGVGIKHGNVSVVQLQTESDVNQIQIERNTFKHNATFIGFTAFKQSTQEVVPGDTVIFDGVLLNEGGHYQPGLSRFVCPHTGVYFISLNFKGYGEYTTLAVMKDEIELLVLYTEMPWNIVSTSGLARCSQGEVIFVQSMSSSGGIYGESAIPQTTLSVMMVYLEDMGMQLHESFIGFTSRKSTRQDYISLDLITFDEVMLNEGGNFQPELSRFLCSQEGIYFTSTTFCKYFTYDLYTGLAKDSVFMMHSQDTMSNHYNTLSNSRLIRCSEGEYITVRATGAGSICGSNTSSFTVMLMSPQQGSLSGGYQLHNGLIGFSAWKRSPQTYINGDTIEFDGVMVNEGEAYQPITSRFTCPCDGIYFTSMTFVKSNTDSLQLEVSRDTIPFLRVETEVENPWNTVGNSGLIRCMEGQDISVKAFGSGSVHGHHSEALCTFTVMLMFED